MTFPKFEEQFNLPTESSNDDSLLGGELVRGETSHKKVQSARASRRWVGVLPLRLASVRIVRRRSAATVKTFPTRTSPSKMSQLDLNLSHIGLKFLTADRQLTSRD